MVDKEIKYEFIEGGFYYEAIQLFYCIHEVRKLNHDESRISVPNYIAVAFSTHARNLWEFFYGEDIPLGKWPRVNHYVSDWNILPSLEIKKWYGMINKHLSHMDYHRKGLPPVAYIYGAYRHFRELINVFLNKLPPNFLGSKLKELKEIMKVDTLTNP